MGDLIKHKVLIAEDNKDLQFIYQQWIGDRYELITAYNGEEAVTKYKEYAPDITLMDIKMPVMTGDDAAGQILEHNPDAKIIAVTAYGYSKEELGFPVMRKLFKKDDFLEMIHKGLNGRFETVETY